jgi:hypothetical protein
MLYLTVIEHAVGHQDLYLGSTGRQLWVWAKRPCRDRALCSAPSGSPHIWHGVQLSSCMSTIYLGTSWIWEQSTGRIMVADATCEIQAILASSSDGIEGTRIRTLYCLMWHRSTWPDKRSVNVTPSPPAIKYIQDLPSHHGSCPCRIDPPCPSLLKFSIRKSASLVSGDHSENVLISPEVSIRTSTMVIHASRRTVSNERRFCWYQLFEYHLPKPYELLPSMEWDMRHAQSL